MPTPMAAPAVLDREFLEMRAKVLELAASFDRLDRGDGDIGNDQRIARIREALEVLMDNKPDRAEQIQLIFSRAYDDDWQRAYGMQ